MVSGQALLIAIAIALGIWAGEGIVKGVKHVGHSIKCTFHHTETCEPKDAP